ncbi:MAG: CHAT domain-containing protein [Bacteroidaceae bacterium]|nr:CHAT domain-containing protein [Bacteroidaceae bacterium]
MNRIFTKVIIIVVCFLSIVKPIEAQTITQLESKWASLYQNGFEALDKHDYKVAEEKFISCIKLLTDNGATNTTLNVYSLIKLGETYYAEGKTREQEYVTKDILGIRQMIKPGSKRFLDYSYCLGEFYSNTGRFKESIKELNEGLSYKKELKKMPDIESKMLHRKALCYFFLNNIKKAILTEEKSVLIDQNKTPEYYKTLAFFYYKISDWKKLEAVIPNVYDYSREPILRKFAQSKSDERAFFWSTEGLFYTDYLPYYAFQHPSDLLVSYTYDAALFSKGILLSASNKSSELTLNSDDPTLIELYHHYLELKDKKEKTIDEEFEMQALSDVFLKHQKEHKNEFREYFRIGWQDIQKKLKSDDIAIEFIMIPNEKGNDEYLALTIRKDSKNPKLTKLGSLNDISSVSDEIIYSSPQLYNRIWKPLESELGGIENVFFSPTGILHNIGIEYLPNEDEINFCAMKNVFRLSSTKELISAKRKNLKRGVLFGGINYDTKVIAKQIQKKEPNAPQIQIVPVDSLNLRGTSSSGGFSYLKGTREEVKEISKSFSKIGIKSEMYLGDKGSEESIKSLTGKAIDFVHIATHGFYFAQNNLKRKTVDELFNKTCLHFTNDGIQRIEEDKMLTRSGLILAGANNVIKKETISNDTEDGILHANEISNLNFSSVNLLVLSACQSGLGDLAACEGVFGLQRGFKLAGVGSIVMSLWKVDDEATKILMTNFYENIIAGQSKREALINAQISLRIKDQGKFDEPKFWASFVLLDALD